MSSRSVCLTALSFHSLSLSETRLFVYAENGYIQRFLFSYLVGSAGIIQGICVHSVNVDTLLMFSIRDDDTFGGKTSSLYLDPI